MPIYSSNHQRIFNKYYLHFLFYFFTFGFADNSNLLYLNSNLVLVFKIFITNLNLVCQYLFVI